MITEKQIIRNHSDRIEGHFDWDFYRDIQAMFNNEEESIKHLRGILYRMQIAAITLDHIINDIQVENK